MKPIAVLMLLAALAGGAPQTHAPDWSAWKFLLGEWTAEGGGQPGAGSGSFTFRLDLDGQILVRDNRADYPASPGHPAYSHRDLMVIYPESGGQRFRAIYFDNEGHVIRYTTRFTATGVVFTSAASASSPRYRLTYARSEGGQLKIGFEIAPPGHPSTFSTYLEGMARPAASRQK